MAQQQENAAPITPEEYFAMCERDLQNRYEYIYGYPRMMSGSTQNHSDISHNCCLELDNALRAKNAPCKVKNSDTALAIGAKRYYLPDAMVTCDSQDISDGLARFISHPSLIAEVLSVSTEATDRTEKLFAYSAVRTVQAYLLIHTDQIKAEVMRRGDDDNLSKVTIYSAGETIDLDFLGMSITVDSLYFGTTKIGR